VKKFLCEYSQGLLCKIALERAKSKMSNKKYRLLFQNDALLKDLKRNIDLDKIKKTNDVK